MAVPRYSAGQQTWKSGGILSASEGLYKKLRAPGLPWPRVPVGSDCVRWRLTKTLATWCHLTENGHTPNSEWERNIRPNVQQQKCSKYSTPLFYVLYCWHVLLMLLSSFALLHFAETRERTECGQGATSSTSSWASWASWAWSSCLAAAACTIDTNLNQSAQFYAQSVKSCTNGTNGILCGQNFCFLITLARTDGRDDHGGHRNLKSNRSCQSKPSAHRVPMSFQQFWNCLEGSGSFWKQNSIGPPAVSLFAGAQADKETHLEPLSALACRDLESRRMRKGIFVVGKVGTGLEWLECGKIVIC